MTHCINSDVSCGILRKPMDNPGTNQKGPTVHNRKFSYFQSGWGGLNEVDPSFTERNKFDGSNIELLDVSDENLSGMSVMNVSERDTMRTNWTVIIFLLI